MEMPFSSRRILGKGLTTGTSDILAPVTAGLQRKMDVFFLRYVLETSLVLNLIVG